MSSPSNPAAAFTMKQCRRNKKQKTTALEAQVVAEEEAQVVAAEEEAQVAVVAEEEAQVAVVAEEEAQVAVVAEEEAQVAVVAEEEAQVVAAEEEEEEEEGGGTTADKSNNPSAAFTMKPCRRNKKRKTKALTTLVEEKPECIHTDDILCSTLFERDSLVCSSADDDKTTTRLIPAAQVLSKTIGLLFIRLHGEEEPHFLSPLINAYNQIQRTHPQDFEIVFLPIFPEDNDQTNINSISPSLVPLKEHFLFHVHLSRMPWPAIPLGAWRKHLIQRYDHNAILNQEKMLIFDPSGTLLYHDGLNDLAITYGPDIFPFTEARVMQVIDQYEAAYLHANSLKDILGDILVTNSGQRAKERITGRCDTSVKTLHISQIQGKVIGLYFYHGIPLQDDRFLHDQFFLMDLENCRRRSPTKHNFQVVFINLDHEGGFRSEESFNSFLCYHPWLVALPFGDSKRTRSLTLILDLVNRDCDRNKHFSNSMVIVNQDGNNSLSYNPYGYEIIKEYGYKAYPFTLKRVAEIEKERMTRKLTLNDIFKVSKVEFVVRSGTGEPKHVSYLENKRVILLFLRHLPSYLPSLEAIRKLRDVQKRQSGSNSFQVVVLDEEVNTKDLNALLRNVGAKKWLRFSSFCTETVRYSLWKNLKVQVQNEIFLGFDENGRFLKMGSLGLISAIAGFPFIKDKTYNRVFWRYLVMSKEWILREEEKDDD